jgi:hypothetical protein
MTLKTPPSKKTRIANSAYRFLPERWRQKNILYYKDIEKLYQFYVRPDSNILEIGSGTGYLLASVKPKYGLGVDLDQRAIQFSRERFPHLNFLAEDGEFYENEEKFDYILLANTISYLQDLHQTFNNLQHLCNPDTRLILTFHNPAWEIVLKIATFLKQRMPIHDLNWLSYEDIRNILNLNGFEVICHHKQMLIPRKIWGISLFFNKFIAPLPLVNQFCLTESIVVKPKSSLPQFQIMGIDLAFNENLLKTLKSEINAPNGFYPISFTLKNKK